MKVKPESEVPRVHSEAVHPERVKPVDEGGGEQKTESESYQLLRLMGG